VRGLTVRWSLAGAPADTLERLAEYVEQTSHARFQGMQGLSHKTWRAVPGEWFEGCYVFVSDEARASFQAQFSASAADAPGSQIVGRPPVLVEPCRIVAVAGGAQPFESTARAE
jgi:hypothetical protein